ncbi:hypothetical protein ZWY2020_018601 [Hordeum vulgare]|nr:hypothetical protein ZWY2020_018601 [Hordeum vulgare]
MALLAGPLWAVALVGLLLGRAWRPRWAAGIVAPADPLQLASLDFWRAQLPARIRGPLNYLAGARQQQEQQEDDDEASLQGYVAWLAREMFGEMRAWSFLLWGAAFWSKPRVPQSSEIGKEELAVGKDDLVNLWRLVEGDDGGPAWIKMMEKALPNMTYQAWWHLLNSRLLLIYLTLYL